MNNANPVYIFKKPLTSIVKNNINYCRYNDDIQMIYLNKNHCPTKRGWANYIVLKSSWLNPIVTYMPLTIQYKNKHIPIICQHKNT